jgi:peptidoglycan/xylan/chitin deacetylase (PgdA/CDA1 family)
MPIREVRSTPNADSIVLCYHALSHSWDAALSTTPELFERQVDLLLGRGYRPVRFSEAARTPATRRVFAVTFDDAYRSVIELGLPILERLHVPATMFAATDYVGSEKPMAWPGIEEWVGGPFEHELMPMSWNELGQLADAGWEIGSHTGSHPHLTQLDAIALADELTRSKAACERHLPGPCASLAYPYGDFDARVMAAAAQAGYATAATLPARLTGGGPLDWPRIGIYRPDVDWRFRLKVSPQMRRLRSSRAWTALGTARQLLGRRSGPQGLQSLDA